MKYKIDNEKFIQIKPKLRYELIGAILKSGEKKQIKDCFIYNKYNKRWCSVSEYKWQDTLLKEIKNKNLKEFHLIYLKKHKQHPDKDLYINELEQLNIQTDENINDSSDYKKSVGWIETNNPKIMEYLDKFINLDLSSKIYHSHRAPRLFYLWGHSYEFDNNNNWNLLEEICEKISGNDEIWYATNMEIYNYVEAYNSLVLSADETIIYNPTLIDIWLDIDGVVYKVASGETIKI